MITTLEISSRYDADFIKERAGIGGTSWGSTDSMSDGFQSLSFPASLTEAIYEAINTYDEAWLERQKTETLERIAVRRRQASQDFTFAGMSIVLDPETESAISKAIQGLQRQDATSFISFEIRRGVFVKLDLIWLQALGDAAFSLVQACFANVERLSLLVDAATTLEELEAIDINTGWPE